MVIFHRTLESFTTFFGKRKIKPVESKYALPFLCALSFGIMSQCYAEEKQHMKTSFKKLFNFLWGSDEDYEFKRIEEPALSVSSKIQSGSGSKNDAKSKKAKSEWMSDAEDI